VNLTGVFLIARHAAKVMIAHGHGGRIVTGVSLALVTDIDDLHSSKLQKSCCTPLHANS
jgi:hypothetical protein